LVAVVEAEGETVLVAVVHEAAVVEEAGENAGLGRPQHWNQQKMKQDIP
jgi:hypothetical protein